MDTNILRRMPFDGPMADVVRVLQKAKIQRVAVPWVVQEEYAAQKAIAYREAHQKAESAMNALKGLTPWWGPEPSLEFDEERLRDHWRHMLEKLVEVLPASEQALREGVFREANALAPCKQNRNGKTDFRDAVIWATVMEFARENLDETVYFVSEDRSAFGGDGASYRHPMDVEVEGLGDRFVHLTDLEQVLNRFTSEAVPNVEAITVQLRARESTSYIRWLIKQRAMTGGDREKKVPGAVLGYSGEYIAGTYWDGTPEVFLGSVRDARSVGIDDHVWSLARVRWVAVGRMRARVLAGPVAVPTATTWETLVLLSPPHEERKLVILDAESPRPASDDEMAGLPRKLVADLLATTTAYSSHVVTRSRLMEIMDGLTDPDAEATVRPFRYESDADDQDLPGVPL
ncbi:PIN domain-containing protein [Streptomyces albidoflavus]